MDNLVCINLDWIQTLPHVWIEESTGPTIKRDQMYESDKWYKLYRLKENNSYVNIQYYPD